MDYEAPFYSNIKVSRAGRVLKNHIAVFEDANESLDYTPSIETLEAFKIAHNWRYSHLFPMLAVQRELSGKLRGVNSLIASRLKRMAAVRRKLNRTPLSLHKIQDIAGCRAIVSSCEDLNEIATIYRSGGSKHSIKRVNDYVESPKPDGYRSLHITLGYAGDRTAYHDLSVEIQLRTELQHIWATTVEAVGLMRGENIKGGAGDVEWRRLFQLMSCYFAYEENKPRIAGLDLSLPDLRQEIIASAKMTGALITLENYKSAINQTGIIKKGEGFKSFLLQFDHQINSLNVEPFREYDLAQRRYIEEEGANSTRNTVLVQVNRVEDLRRAYPNYFLDVGAFTERLREIIITLGNKNTATKNIARLAAFKF